MASVYCKISPRVQPRVSTLQSEERRCACRARWRNSGVFNSGSTAGLRLLAMAEIRHRGGAEGRPQGRAKA